MTLQAWHTYIWGVSLILLCRSSQALLGWMGSIAVQLFSGLSRDVQVRALAGAVKDIQKLVPKPLLACPEATPDLSVLCCVHLSLDPE